MHTGKIIAFRECLIADLLQSEGQPDLIKPRDPFAGAGTDLCHRTPLDLVRNGKMRSVGIFNVCLITGDLNMIAAVFVS